MPKDDEYLEHRFHRKFSLHGHSHQDAIDDLQEDELDHLARAEQIEEIGPDGDEIYFIDQKGHGYDEVRLIAPEVIDHILKQVQSDETVRTSSMLYKAMPIELEVPSDDYTSQFHNVESDYYQDYLGQEVEHPYAPFDYHIEHQYARKPIVEKSILDDLVPIEHHKTYEFVHDDYDYEHVAASQPVFEMHFMHSDSDADEPEDQTQEEDEDDEDYESLDEQPDTQPPKQTPKKWDIPRLEYRFGVQEDHPEEYKKK